VAEQPNAAFRMDCPACGARMKVPPGQVGQKCRCPRCDAEVLVPARSRISTFAEDEKPPKPPAPVAEEDEEFRLSELVDRLPPAYGSPLDVRGRDSLPAATPPREPPPRPATGRQRDLIGRQARQVFTQAQAEAEEVERAAPRLPERPHWQLLTAFLFDGDAAWRWLLLSLLLHVTTTLLVWIVELSGSPGIAQVGALGLTLAALPCGLAFVAVAAASCLAILQDTSNGFDKIDSWPGLPVADWIMDVFYVINALLAAVLPGLFLGSVWMCLGGNIWSAVWGGASSGIALFPLFLTSMAAEGSCFSVAAPAVWNTVWTQRRLWGRFYLLSAGLGVAVLLLAPMVARCGFLVRGICSALAVAAMMIYFRLLGALAWTIAARPSR
jgi:hypothetical protein